MTESRFLLRTLSAIACVIASLQLVGCAATRQIVTDQVARSGSDGLFGQAFGKLLDPNARTSEGEPLLVAAARQQKQAHLLDLLAAGADVSATDAQGRSALYWSLKAGATDAVDRLIRAGGSFPAMAQPLRHELLCQALRQRDVRILRMATAAGLKDVLSPCEPDGVNPVYLAAVSGLGLNELVDAGADINAPLLADAATPLLWAIRRSRDDVGALLRSGADPNRSSAGVGPLGLALQSGDFGTVHLLARHGANLDNVPLQAWRDAACRSMGRRASSAAAAHRIDAVKTLVVPRVGADFRCDGEPAIVIAIRLGDQGLAGALLSAGADASIRDAKGEHLLVLGYRSGGASMLDFLAAHRAGPSARTLSLNDIESLPALQEEARLQRLSRAGLPAPVMIAVAGKRACAAAPWDSRREATRQRIFTAHWKLLWEYRSDADAVNALLGSHRQCLEAMASSVRASGAYPYKATDDGLPELTADALGVAKIRTVQALTYLAPADARHQDPAKARQLMVEVQEEVQQVARQVAAAYEAYAQSQLQKRRTREAAAQRNDTIRMIAGVVAGVAMANRYGGTHPGAVRQFTENYFNGVKQARRLDRAAVEAIAIDVPSLKAPASWDDDGVRLFVPRFDSFWNSGSLESNPGFDHTYAILRLTSTYPSGRSGSCTAAVIGPGQLLTAQHCVVDTNGQHANAIRVENEFMSAIYSDGGTTLGIDGQRFNGTWEVKTGRGFYRPDWRHDWAVLQLQGVQSKELPVRLRNQIPLARAGVLQLLQSQGIRVAIAGYAGHLNHGQFLTMDWGCKLRESDGRVGLMEHACKGWKGDSGAPVVVAEGPHKGSVLGVVSHHRGPAASAGDEKSVRTRIRNRTDDLRRFAVTVDEIHQRLSSGEFSTWQVNSEP